MLSVCAIAAGGLYLFRGRLYAPLDPVQDPAAHAVELRRMSAVAADLNRVTTPDATRPTGRAISVGCSADSGEVFEPSASRIWGFTRASHGITSLDPLKAPDGTGDVAMANIATQLIAMGWSGQARVRYEAGASFIELTKPLEDRAVDLVIQGYDDSVITQAEGIGHRVCRGSH